MRATYSTDPSTRELQDEGRARAGRRVGDRWRMIQGVHQGQEALLLQRFGGGRTWQTMQAIGLDGSLLMQDAWHAVGAAGEPAFLNAWTNVGGTYAIAAFRRDLDGTVFLRGLVSSGVVAQPIFVLPAGYRPAAKLLLVVVSNGALGEIEVRPDGNVVLNAGSNLSVSLSGLSFKAEA